jgi:hypothetical protein
MPPTSDNTDHNHIINSPNTKSPEALNRGPYITIRRRKRAQQQTVNHESNMYEPCRHVMMNLKDEP